VELDPGALTTAETGVEALEMGEKVGVTHWDRPAFDLPRVDVLLDLGRVLAEAGDESGCARVVREAELIPGLVRGPGTE
jgi:hypothetical protein